MLQCADFMHRSPSFDVAACPDAQVLIFSCCLIVVWYDHVLRNSRRVVCVCVHEPETARTTSISCPRRRHTFPGVSFDFISHSQGAHKCMSDSEVRS